MHMQSVVQAFLGEFHTSMALAGCQDLRDRNNHPDVT
jgi:isopentenyl diphosphate isomerase/L-lactate dehydrogenase-like FMN-dependent dehydrogenase